MKPPPRQIVVRAAPRSPRPQVPRLQSPSRSSAAFSRAAPNRAVADLRHRRRPEGAPCPRPISLLFFLLAVDENDSVPKKLAAGRREFFDLDQAKIVRISGNK